MSTPECEKAKSYHTPPAKQSKDSFNPSLKMLVTRHLWPSINATSALQADVDSTKYFCLIPDIDNPETLLGLYPTCSLYKAVIRE